MTPRKYIFQSIMFGIYVQFRGRKCKYFSSAGWIRKNHQEKSIYIMDETRLVL